MTKQNTIICTDFSKELIDCISDRKGKDIFILVDDKTKDYCLPEVLKIEKLQTANIITITNGDENKNIESAISIWGFFVENGATRHSLMINIGGGMITDIGGFTASTFKRGMDYINVSTTLLGAVDAATGGKTGINFLGLKNEVGVFSPAKKVLINVDFFKTLDARNIRSGFAEMIKHALISTKQDWNEVLSFDLENIDFGLLKVLLQKNIDIKENIVALDPTEKGIRKALNLGHTFGHAFESLSYKKGNPILHGYAVAWGLISELYLSVIKLGFPKEEFIKLKYFIGEHYGKFNCGCNDYKEIITLMKHDKKNSSEEEINFTLLSDVGQIKINQTASIKEIEECIDILF